MNVIVEDNNEGLLECTRVYGNLSRHPRVRAVLARNKGRDCLYLHVCVMLYRMLHEHVHACVLVCNWVRGECKREKRREEVREKVEQDKEKRGGRRERERGVGEGKCMRSSQPYKCLFVYFEVKPVFGLADHTI